MPEVALNKTFLESYNHLSKQKQKIVYQKVNKLAAGDINPGFNFHKLEREDCDPHFRSARISRDLRLILYQKGDTMILLHVDGHDEAYRWAHNKYLDNSNFNALYLRDTELESRKVEEQRQKNKGRSSDQPSLLQKQGLRQKDLEKLGLTAQHAEFLMAIADEDQFFDFIIPYPEEIKEALLDLCYGTRNMTQVYADLNDPGTGQQGSALESLDHKDSRRRFYLLQGQEEFKEILEDQDKWKLFLHPHQDRLVRGQYRGPVLVEGGPGTGKTVVGIHRAVHLAHKVYPARAGHQILFCTFSKKLAGYIREKVEELARQKGVENNIQVRGADQIINTILNQEGLEQGRVDLEGLQEIWEKVYLEMDPSEPLTFFQTEYEEVIQKNRISHLEQYLEVARPGQGSPLQPSQRRRLWPVFAEFMRCKEEEGLIDFEDRALILQQALEEGRIKPRYASLIIDEAQDLSSNKLQALKGLVDSEENNLMILSDQNQRIFRLTSWKRETGIAVVGRSYYLNLNYRLTREIREFADRQFLLSRPEDAHLRGFKSFMSGPQPVEKQFSREKEQYIFICQEIKRCGEEGIAAHNICIVTPAGLEKIAGVLEMEEISHQILRGEEYPRPGEGVALSTMHGVKGLEFQVVIIPFYNKIGRWLDKEEIKQDRWYCRDREGQVDCLRYVAATRARERLIISSIEEEK